MIIALILSILSLVAALYNLTQGAYRDSAGGLGISAVFAGVFFLARNRKSENTNFLIWLKENREELKSNRLTTLQWRSVPVKYESYITQYQYCLSFLVVTFRQPTGFILEHSPDRLWVNLGATILTLLVGWWGIPWGPIYTVQSVIRNLRGGVKISIAELLSQLDSATPARNVNAASALPRPATPARALTLTAAEEPTIYLYESNTQLGPYTRTQVRDMRACGSVSPSTLFCREGMNEWRPVEELE